MQSKIMTEIYEVKTDVSRQSLYTAIGQLLVHSGEHQTVKQFVVLPDGEVIPPDVEQALKRLKVNVVRFTVKTLSIKIHPY